MEKYDIGYSDAVDCVLKSVAAQRKFGVDSLHGKNCGKLGKIARNDLILGVVHTEKLWKTLLGVPLCAKRCQGFGKFSRSRKSFPQSPQKAV